MWFKVVLTLVLVIVVVKSTTLEDVNYTGMVNIFFNECSNQYQQIESQMTIFSNLELQVKQNQEAIEKLESESIERDTPRSYYSGNLPKNCKEVQERGSKVSHIYRIRPNLSSKSFFVLCNMNTKGGGWTYLLNRFDGSQDFFLGWKEYKNGFGNLAGESWLGLEHLYQLTGDEINELLIELVDQDQEEVYAHYSAFSIGDASEGYKLKILGGYTGDAGDSFSQHVGMKFSTKDEDQDVEDDSCATMFGGAWWYIDGCYHSHLTGRYLSGKLSEADGKGGIHWGTFHGYNYSLLQARMMIRPKDYNSLALVPHDNDV